MRRRTAAQAAAEARYRRTENGRFMRGLQFARWWAEKGELRNTFRRVARKVAAGERGIGR